MVKGLRWGWTATRRVRAAGQRRVVIEHDYTRKPLYAGEFDLGWSVEFVEHVEERFVPNLMATFRGCRYVFLTAAVPGQPGHHHVNCRPAEYWVDHFKRAGFALDADATEGVRRHSTMESRFASAAPAAAASGSRSRCWTGHVVRGLTEPRRGRFPVHSRGRSSAYQLPQIIGSGCSCSRPRRRRPGGPVFLPS